jgi:heme exporter protein A
LIDDALSRVGLARLRDFPTQYLSAGQRRRIALARLLLSQRSLWLLDEPLSSLDREGKTVVRELVETHCSRGGMVVAATHEPIGAAGGTLELS